MMNRNLGLTLGALGLALMVGSARNQSNGIRVLGAEQMKGVFGGGCGAQCTNACGHSVDECMWGSCQAGGEEGVLCTGGGGGSGTAWNCISSMETDPNAGCAPSTGQMTQCTPAKACRCSGGLHNVCQSLDALPVNGTAGTCTAYRCGS